MGVIRRGKRGEPEEKLLDVDASMQGTMVFKDPVNLRINGRFEGKLDTKGSLTIGANAEVIADITGEEITIAGRVAGNIIATTKLSIVAPAMVNGDIRTPSLSITDGATLNGHCQMSSSAESTITTGSGKEMMLDEVARYLEVEPSLVEEWATKKKLPAVKKNNTWQFFKDEVDSWVAKEKVGQ